MQFWYGTRPRRARDMLTQKRSGHGVEPDRPPSMSAYDPTKIGQHFLQLLNDYEVNAVYCDSEVNLNEILI